MPGKLIGNHDLLGTIYSFLLDSCFLHISKDADLRFYLSHKLLLYTVGLCWGGLDLVSRVVPGARGLLPLHCASILNTFAACGTLKTREAKGIAS